LAANHKPTIRGSDFAIWRRIKLVPFTTTITAEEKDKHLGDKLKEELSGILNWAVDGCLAWQREGLDEPDEVRQATETYQAEEDTICQFIAECCFVNPEAKARASELLEAYCKWSGDKEMKPKMFGQKLKAKGYENRPGTGGYTFWHGLGLPHPGVEDS